jgi:hypothetical protein
MIIRRNAVAPFDFDGLNIRDYTAGLDTGSSFAVISASPGASHVKVLLPQRDRRDRHALPVAHAEFRPRL